MLIFVWWWHVNVNVLFELPQKVVKKRTLLQKLSFYDMEIDIDIEFAAVAEGECHHRVCVSELTGTKAIFGTNESTI